MKTEDQQNLIIGRLTCELEYAKDTLRRNNESRDNRKKELGYSHGESFDVVWADMVSAREFAWRSFIDRAADKKEECIDGYDEYLLDRNFTDMLRKKDFVNIDKYIEESTLPF